MKSTITTVLSVLVVTLALATTASAAPSAAQLSASPGHAHQVPKGAESIQSPGAPAVARSASSSPGKVRAAYGSSVSGRVVSSPGGLPIGGASVTIQYWNINQGRWISLASQQANSGGYYRFSMTSGYYYRISAAAVTGRCNFGGGSIATWSGLTGYIFASNGRSFNLPVSMVNTSFRVC